MLASQAGEQTGRHARGHSARPLCHTFSPIAAAAQSSGSGGARTSARQGRQAGAITDKTQTRWVVLRVRVQHAHPCVRVCVRAPHGARLRGRGTAGSHANLCRRARRAGDIGLDLQPDMPRCLHGRLRIGVRLQPPRPSSRVAPPAPRRDARTGFSCVKCPTGWPNQCLFFCFKKKSGARLERRAMLRSMARTAARAGHGTCPTAAHCWYACRLAPARTRACVSGRVFACPGAFARSLGTAASSGGCATPEDIKTLTAAAKRQSHLFPAWLQVAFFCSVARAHTPLCVPGRQCGRQCGRRAHHCACPPH